MRNEFHFRLGPRHGRMLERLARETGRTLTECVRTALDAAWDAHETRQADRSARRRNGAAAAPATTDTP